MTYKQYNQYLSVNMQLKLIFTEYYTVFQPIFTADITQEKSDISCIHLAWSWTGSPAAAGTHAQQQTCVDCDYAAEVTQSDQTQLINSL